MFIKRVELGCRCAGFAGCGSRVPVTTRISSYYVEMKELLRLACGSSFSIILLELI